MTASRRSLCISNALIYIFVLASLFKANVIIGSPECSSYDFPCEDGECIDAALWCDTQEDCSDGTDEKYCKKAEFLNSNPNMCPSTYFKCHYGPCIPIGGRCDGYGNCEDSSDEQNCDGTTLPSGDTMLPSITHYKVIEGSEAVLYFLRLNTSHHSLKLEPFLELNPSGFQRRRRTAREWLRKQRRGNFGWGDATPRVMLALYLSDMQTPFYPTETDMLMIKQLEIQICLDLEKNETKLLKLTDLALYINALLASCKDPKNFYGDNLVHTLRSGVNAAQKTSKFVNPSVYLTLCMNNVTTHDDVRNLQDIIFGSNATIDRVDIQAMALLTMACIFRETNLLNASMYDDIKKEFLQRLQVYGFPGNVHEAAFIFQALKEMKLSLAGLSDFILSQQQADGSFGDILSTYLVLPILAGKNILQMNDHCDQQNASDITPIEVLKNARQKKIQVQYSLIYGFPTEITQTIQIQVPEGSNVLDVMRLAQEINLNYKFKLSKNRKVSVVYSIGEMPNDAEKGMYWTFYKTSANSTDDRNPEHWVPNLEDIKHLILEDGDKVSYWFKPI